MFIKKIINNIFLGNHETVLNDNLLKQYKVDYVINCTRNKYVINNDIVDIISFPSYDPPTHEDFKYISKNIVKLVEKIDDIVKKNKRIVIFCHKGRHRSVMLCIAYLMYKFKINSSYAFYIIKYIHPEAFSHIGKSMIYLLEYFNKLLL
mgnify:FL=1|tara:strand:- start:25 stop:471 length:447 start_codon:yes stop_codon:yes gene_type:complete